MKSYRCLKQPIYNNDAYTIVPIREEDKLPIKTWRNEQMDVLRQKKLLSDEEQTAYFRNVVLPTFDMAEPPMVLVSFLFQGQSIGYGGLTNLDWEAQRAEISFLLETARTLDPARYQSDFQAFLMLIKQLAFEDLQINRLFTETYDIRPHHIAVIEQSGFTLEGRMRQHVRIGDRYVDSLIHGCLKENYDAIR